jgi:chemotaxis response regulator CheB
LTQSTPSEISTQFIPGIHHAIISEYQTTKEYSQIRKNKNPMRRVLLVATGSLFGKGVENLLIQEQSLEFMGCESDVVKAIEMIKVSKPDVVIVEKDILATDLGHTLRNLLWSCMKLKVIELDPADECISVHSSQQKLVKKVKDLVDVIEQSDSA